MYLIVLLLLSCVLYYFCRRNNLKKWETLNVPGPKPIPILGNMKDVALLRASQNDVFNAIYKKFPDCKYVGIYVMEDPAILLRDPEIVENVLVKNFANFHDNSLLVTKETDPILGNNPFTSKGEHWKNKRIQHLAGVTPARVKLMFPEINECANRMISYLNKQIEKHSGKFCMESLELAARYTTESITAIGFGIISNSFTDEKPELRIAGKVIAEPSILGGTKAFLLFLIPKLANLLTTRLVPKPLLERYERMVVETLRYRRENNIKKNDFFDHVQEFRGERMSIEEMTAQIGGLYIDGFGTNSSALNFIFYVLAAHEEIQDKLRSEIEECLEKNNGVLTFDLIQEMSYLDAVISESLRRFPPFPNLFKTCTKTCVLPKASKNSSALTVEVGTTIVIPTYSIQNDEKFFPNPDKCDPERFLDEKKQPIKKYSYIPFGEGPRMCLGMRLATLQSKIALIKLVQNFKLSVNYSKTKAPVQLHPYCILLAAKGGFWINFVKLS